MTSAMMAIRMRTPGARRSMLLAPFASDASPGNAKRTTGRSLAVRIIGTSKALDATYLCLHFARTKVLQCKNTPVGPESIWRPQPPGLPGDTKTARPAYKGYRRGLEGEAGPV